MRKAVAFIKKDFQIFCSYKLSFLIHWLGIPVSVTTFYFLSKLIDRQRLASFSGYAGGYFLFVLLGLVLFSCLRSILGSFSQSIRQDQLTGTLEAILSTSIKPSAMIIYMGLWDLIFSSLTAMAYLLTGILFFGVRFPKANIAGVVVIWFLTSLVFSGIGILCAAFILVFKKGNPLAWFTSSLSGLLGGVYFPVSIFPKYLQFVAHSLPLTYSLKALRNAALNGDTLFRLAPDIFVLSIFSVFLLPFSIFIFNLAVKKVKRDGSLTYY